MKVHRDLGELRKGRTGVAVFRGRGVNPLSLLRQIHPRACGLIVAVVLALGLICWGLAAAFGG